MKKSNKFLGRITRYTQGWLLTDPVLFTRKDAAYPENPEDIILIMNKMMVKYEFYKNPSLTIGYLCRETNTNRSYLSRSIHRMYGTNFCEWVNIFRIDEAKRLIDKETRNKIDLEDLSMACGFNSVRSFCRVFKSRVSCTPRQYFKRNRKM
ncbi:MAG TPA: AraC family transcriptional regulator [Bacteroidales bacterium]|nr:AraC family transcriptional regulator [Bacteroidales bacterium]HOR11631.1 AraC family transcriptional regulator [Bacteroidales bacterium]HOZ19285.1 AraC family transcriptional regulator [Bacteroidales bacterium]HPK38905.1 AraC family transcriptional regulator [Bacteroidales bacterium]